MNKGLPYIIGSIGLVLLCALIFFTGRNNHVFDTRVSLNRHDKIPYGTYVAYQNLHRIFPQASISINRQAPGYWDSLDVYGVQQVLVSIVPTFRASEPEMARLVNFIKAGNTVLISTAVMPSEIQTLLHCEMPEVYDVSEYFGTNKDLDTFSVSLSTPPFSKEIQFGCPGKRYESFFSHYDAGISAILGSGIEGQPNFIRFRAGRGTMYIHLTPLAFSNYFLLREHNIDYYNKLMSLIPADSKRVVWDEYFMYKRSGDAGNADSKTIFSALMSQRSFRAALWLLLALLLLFLLQEMRRKQRLISKFAAPQNDSMEFVKTIGRLYYEKRDNKNLCRKMTAYFLEYIRNTYKLGTGNLDDAFMNSLFAKTGYPKEQIREIVSFINDIESKASITDQELFKFHANLEQFYREG